MVSTHGHVEIVGFDEIHERFLEEGRRALRELDVSAAVAEYERVVKELEAAGWRVERFETPHERDPPIVRVRLRNNVVLYVIVYPPRWNLILSQILDVLGHVLEAKEGEDVYKVIVFYTRRGRLGTAAYLYLGFTIEAWGVGILFVNGDYGELVEVARVLEEKGRYVPTEDEVVPVK